MNYHRTYNEIHDVTDISDASELITEPVTLEEMKNFLRLEGFSTDGTNITAEAPLTKTLLESATTIQDDLLKNATILTLAREGTIYTKAVAVGNRKFTHNPTTGVIAFEAEGEPGGEGIDITYGYTGSIGSDDAFDADNDLIEELITASRERLEKWLWLSIIQHTWQVLFTNLAGDIEFPFSNGMEVVSLKDSEDEDIEADDYKFRGTTDKHLARPLFENMTVVYAAGYEVGSVPKAIKQAIMRDVAFHYENRNDDDRDKVNKAFEIAIKYKRVSTWLA